MKSWDIEAYTFDGDIYCSAPCVPEAWRAECVKVGCTSRDEKGLCDRNCHGCGPNPVFADSAGELVGGTCGSCGAFYAPDGEGWQYGADPKDYRWARCDCGQQVPYFKPDNTTRLDAMRGELECGNCLGKLHF